MRLERIDRFAQRHHGLINKAAAARLGITRAEWYLAISSGHLEQLYPNVARVWGSPPTLRSGCRRTHPSMLFHAIVIGYEVDFQIDGTQVILECDGWGSHGLDRDQFEFDRIRNAELVAAGYVIVHFTWRRLRDDAAWVASKIRQVLDRWASGPRSAGSGRDSSP